jgi:hypothetical protein
LVKAARFHFSQSNCPSNEKVSWTEMCGCSAFCRVRLLPPRRACSTHILGKTCVCLCVLVVCVWGARDTRVLRKRTHTLRPTTEACAQRRAADRRWIPLEDQKSLEKVSLVDKRFPFWGTPPSERHAKSCCSFATPRLNFGHVLWHARYSTTTRRSIPVVPNQESVTVTL